MPKCSGMAKNVTSSQHHLKKTTTIEQTKDEEKNIVKLKQISSFLNKLTFQPEVLGISCMQSFVMFWGDRPVLYSTKLKHHNTFTIHCTEIHKKNTQLKGEKPKKNHSDFSLTVVWIYGGLFSQKWLRVITFVHRDGLS